MNNSLKLHVQKIENLPTLPLIAQEILAVTDDNLASLKKLEQITENDPAISAKILSTANSAFFGFKSPVKTIGNAILRIGFDNVRSIAIGIAIMTILNDGNRRDKAVYKRIFSHSLSTGIVSKILSKYLQLGIEDEAFIGGILHDIGFLVLSKYFPDSFHNVFNEFEKGTSLPEAEKLVLEFSHMDIGYWLVKQWSLPENVLAATLFHHMPADADDYPKHVAVTHLADYLTTKYILGLTEKSPGYPFESSCLDILGISDSDVNAIKTEIKDGSFFNRLFR